MGHISLSWEFIYSLSREDFIRPLSSLRKWEIKLTGVARPFLGTFLFMMIGHQENKTNASVSF